MFGIYKRVVGMSLQENRVAYVTYGECRCDNATWAHGQCIHASAIVNIRVNECLIRRIWTV